MAMQIDAGKTGRADLFMIDPQHILLGKNGRWMDHSEEDVLSMVKSYEEDGGQIEPVEVRRQRDKRVVLTMGFRRYKAAVKYNELHPDAPMMLKCVVTVTNEQEAFVRNIVENRERKATSPVDDAFNQKRLREEFGWAEEQIASRYRHDPSYVCKLKKIPSLRHSILLLVHERIIPFDAAVDLADMSEAEQDAILATAKDDIQADTTAVIANKRDAKAEIAPEDAQGEDAAPETPPTVQETPVEPAIIVKEPGRRKKSQGKDKPNAKAPRKKAGATIKKAIREKKITAGKAKARSLAEVREFFEGLTGPAEDTAVKALATAILDYIRGGTTDNQMVEQIERFVAQIVAI